LGTSTRALYHFSIASEVLTQNKKDEKDKWDVYKLKGYIGGSGTDCPIKKIRACSFTKNHLIFCLVTNLSKKKKTTNLMIFESEYNSKDKALIENTRFISDEYNHKLYNVCEKNKLSDIFLQNDFVFMNKEKEKFYYLVLLKDNNKLKFHKVLEKENKFEIIYDKELSSAWSRVKFQGKIKNFLIVEETHTKVTEKYVILTYQYDKTIKYEKFKLEIDNSTTSTSIRGDEINQILKSSKKDLDPEAIRLNVFSTNSDTVLYKIENRKYEFFNPSEKFEITKVYQYEKDVQRVELKFPFVFSLLRVEEKKKGKLEINFELVIRNMYFDNEFKVEGVEDFFVCDDYLLLSKNSEKGKLFIYKIPSFEMLKTFMTLNIDNSKTEDFKRKFGFSDTIQSDIDTGSISINNDSNLFINKWKIGTLLPKFEKGKR
jgi:hypothetical protein